MKPIDAFSRLTQALKVLPNVGPKSAQRMAYQLLQHKRDGAEELLAALQQALLQVRHCRQCNTFCAKAICAMCVPMKPVPKPG